MKVSIVTISLNQAQFLAAALDSVLAQDYANIEYIVVDPGSTDGSRRILERYRGRLARLILEPDRGPADGLNKGFGYATGQVFAYLNSDDLLLPGAVSEAVAFLRERQAVDIVAGHALIIDQDGVVLRRAYSDPFSLRRYAYGACATVQQSTFIRAASFRATAGFNFENRISWDGELLVDMSIVGAKFSLANRVWSCFRLHPSSITSSRKLHDTMQAQHRRLFYKALGRHRRSADFVLERLSRMERYALNPRDVLERIRFGPIYGRHAHASAARNEKLGKHG